MRVKALHRAISCFLLAAFTMYVVTQTVFLHTHKMPDGTAITHAHPYNKTTEQAPFKTHHHTSVDFMMLHHLHLLFFVIISFAFAQITKTHLIRLADLFRNVMTPFSASVLGRAPPSFT
ncbi:hypothetical protein [Saccharicrinis sp. FJH54]|uniref:hypothetical protein n=1 Tax=Saccharicrinis sp. FJH54 TaxID=3344665 RepID=UPI0035D50A12